MEDPKNQAGSERSNETRISPPLPQAGENETKMAFEQLRRETGVGSVEAPFGENQTARAFEQLRLAIEEHPSDLHRISALQESEGSARDAVRAAIALSPDVLAALGNVMRLPAEHRQIISEVLELPIVVQATLRAIL